MSYASLGCVGRIGIVLGGCISVGLWVGIFLVGLFSLPLVFRYLRTCFGTHEER